MFSFLRSHALTLVGCYFVLAISTFSQESSQKPTDIRVSVDRVSVGTVVTNSRGEFAGGLHRRDFHVFDDGAEQPITDFLNVDEPAQILLLVEAGPAVYLLQGGHLQAVHALLDGLSPSDEVAIARYNEGAEPILNFTPDKRVAADSLEQLRFNLGFGQLNLASSLSTALDWLARVPGKKSLVLLSTGVDTSSSIAIEKIMERLKSTDVRVLAISLSGEMRGSNPAEKKNSKKDQPPSAKAVAATEGFARADAELKAIAEANGGRVYFPGSSKDFAEVFAEIAQLVRHEYSIGFVPPLRDGKVHVIEVRLNIAQGAATDTFASYRLDHRQAYVAPTSEQP